MVLVPLTLALALLGVLAFFASLAVRGQLTLDLGWGRSIHQLGPLVVDIEAPRELVFESISGPYLGRTPKQMRDHLDVLEKGEDFALAAHYTEFALYTAETVEIVHFEPPERVSFRHVRGPVPYADEAFELTEADDGTTELTYSGELGMDFWGLGRLLARTWVVPTWEEEVSGSLENIREIAERRAEARARREARRTDDGT